MRRLGYLGLSLTGGAAAPLSIAIVNNAGTTVSGNAAGYRVTKSAATSNWDADAVSSTGIAGDFTIRLQVVSGSEILAGCNADPLTDSSYTSVDRALVFRLGGNVEAWEDGAMVATPSTWTSADYFFVRRVGTAIKAYKGPSTAIGAATLFYTFTASSATMFFDSSLFTPSCSFDVLFTAP